MNAAQAATKEKLDKWSEGERIVCEREIDEYGTTIRITESTRGFNVYRTFIMGGEVQISCDQSEAPAGEVMSFLLDGYDI